MYIYIYICIYATNVHKRLYYIRSPLVGSSTHSLKFLVWLPGDTSSQYVKTPKVFPERSYSLIMRMVSVELGDCVDLRMAR